jgi:hypothetical protein
MFLQSIENKNDKLIISYVLGVNKPFQYNYEFNLNDKKILVEEKEFFIYDGYQSIDSIFNKVKLLTIFQ